MAIALYARQSVEKENSISCETQLEYCKSVLKPDEREEKILTFVDNGFSGGNTDRESFQNMMKKIRNGSISKVVVYKLDRISRSLSDFVNILNEFKTYNVEFVSSQESFDTGSAYGNMILQLLMVFAEFERTSIIHRVSQAYEHRSELGIYMGGRRPYGFSLVPTTIQNIKTKKLEPVPAEAEQVQYIFQVYAQENVSLRRLLNILAAANRQPLDHSNWTTAKLSTLLKNPIYVKADSDIYDYFDNHGAKIIGDLSLFTGECGAQLYGHTKHKSDNPDWSEMKLVILTHQGLVSSGIWLKCQRKLEKNKQIGNSLSNRTSWLSGKIVCDMCGHTMTTVKSKVNKSGEIRRYFNCTGRSHKRICSGPSVTVYAEDLENMVYDCISEKLSELTGESRKMTTDTALSSEVNALKLKILAIEKSEQQLMDTILSGGFNEDLLKLANQRASQLKQERLVLDEQIEDLKSKSKGAGESIHLSKSWERADYHQKKKSLCC